MPSAIVSGCPGTRRSWRSSGCGSPTAVRSSTRSTASREALLGTAAPDGSLYAALEAAGHRVVRATAQLRPIVADARLATLLGLERGLPLLHIDQTDYDAGGRAVMLSHEWHVADAFDLIVNRRPS